MDVHKLLPQFIGEDLIDVAIKLNYSESNILILKGEEDMLKTKYPKVYQNLLTCRHNKDGRSFLEYGKDLVSSWIFEDYLIKTLKDNGMDIYHAGADKSREILPGAKVSASSDSEIEYNGKKRLLEIMTDYTGYWNRTKKIDLRDMKYDKMKKSKSLFLGVSIVDRKYILIDFDEAINAKYTSFHYAYKKPAYQISITQDMLKSYEVQKVMLDIKNRI